MNDTIPTPHDLAPAALLTRLVELEDRAPLAWIDAAAAHGDAMVAALQDVVDGELSWDSDSRGEWWLLLHAAYILGRIPTEAAGRLLVRLMRAMDEHDDVDLQDWLAGDWPALFANKPRAAIDAACGLTDERNCDWYIRCQALEVMLDAGRRESADALEAALDRAADMAADAGDDWTFRSMAAVALLDFPRQRHRTLLESLANDEALHSEERGDGISAFSAEDVEDSFDANRDAPGWLRRDEPWRFYAPEAIAARQQRWQEEGRDTGGDFDGDGFLADTYVRATPKLGRNDPCPCGSGKKYKRCCLAKDEATARDQLPIAY